MSLSLSVSLSLSLLSSFFLYKFLLRYLSAFFVFPLSFSQTDSFISLSVCLFVCLFISFCLSLSVFFSKFPNSLIKFFWFLEFSNLFDRTPITFLRQLATDSPIMDVLRKRIASLDRYGTVPRHFVEKYLGDRPFG
jgi:hypothetical protein